MQFQVWTLMFLQAPQPTLSSEILDGESGTRSVFCFVLRDFFISSLKAGETNCKIMDGFIRYYAYRYQNSAKALVLR